MRIFCNCREKTTNENYIFDVGIQHIKPDKGLYFEKVMRRKEVSRSFVVPFLSTLKRGEKGVKTIIL
jgi:hypothetical protein